MEKALAGLNPEQRRAVTHKGGPLLVLAGAGSGKTRVLTLRLAWLVKELGIEPWRLLAVTFTNKAAGEMRERTRALLEDLGATPWVSTFHSTCLRILRREIEHVEGLSNDFVIYDADESRRLVKMIVEEARLPKQVNPRAISAVIDRAKNDALTPSDLAKQRKADLDPRVPEIYRRYQERLRKSNAVDFGDLIFETIRLLENREDVRDRYRRRFAHVMVDEYQDTNAAQYRLLRLLADHGDRNVCVVGDEDQSIYSFRGADIRNILDFERDFEGASVVRLERNYRSTETILKAATAVVSANTDRLGKSLWTEAGLGDPITVRVSFDDREEAVKALEIVRREMRVGMKPRDIAIFFRTNAQSRQLEEEFIASRLPFVLIGAQRFYDRKEIKDALSYLKLILNPHDDIAFLRVLNEPPRGIGAGTRKKITEAAVAREISCWDSLVAMAEDPRSKPRLKTSLNRFKDLVGMLRKVATDRPLPSLLEAVLRETKTIERYTEQNTPESLARIDNLEELKNSTFDFESHTPPTGLVEFLDRVSLVSDTDKLEDVEDSGGKVTLMTVHAAKGLEFPVVIVVGMDEDVFPHFRANESEKDLEEERRLAYVAITRAEKRLYLLRARRRRFGGMFKDTDESRFLRLLPRELLTGDVVFSRRATPRRAPAPGPEVAGDSYVVYDNDSDRMPKGWSAPQKSFQSRFDRNRPTRRDAPPPPPIDEPRVVQELGEDALSVLTPGTRVIHPVWGEGEVRELEGSHANPRARIAFRKGGQKLVYLASANLQIVSR